MTADKNASTEVSESRRTFLGKTAKVAAAVGATSLLKTPVYGQNQAPSANVTGANNRLVVAFVGVGAQGTAHVVSQKKFASENNIRLGAVCDLYEKRLLKAKATIEDGDAGNKVDTYADHRKLLERKDIDAITVATVDNWHAQVAIDAMQAGKHVYGEKPLARYLGEGFDVYDTVKKTGKTFMLGSQFCADPMYHKCAEWIRAGKLGPLVWMQGSYCRNNQENNEWRYPADSDASEKNLDWNRWQGKAKKVPWDPRRYFSWHLYYDYNSGILGNLLPHKFLPLMLATGNPEYPRRITCTGTRKVSTQREITDTTHLLAEFPSGLTFLVAGSTVNAQGLQDVIRGRKATLYLSSGQNDVELKPERPFTEEIEAERFRDPADLASLSRLEKNFFDCIRTGKTPYAHIDLALKAHTVLCLAEMAERLSLTLLYDEKKREIKTGDGKIIKPISYEDNVPYST